MIKKQLLVIFFLCATIHLVLSEEALFRIMEDTPAWILRNFPPPLTDANVDIIIPAGSIISGVSSPTFFFMVNGNYGIGHNLGVIFEGVRYEIAANTFAPVASEELFHNSFLTSIDPQAEIWVLPYFLEVLRNGDKQVVVQHEQGWIAFAEEGEHDSWYRDFQISSRSLTVTQATISIGGLREDQFWVRQINRISNGYRVTVTWNTRSAFYYNPRHRNSKINLPTRNETPVFDFHFIFDGDYLDMYYSTDSDGSEKIFSASFIRVDSEMERQINSIIENPTGLPIPFFPERFTFWPRRADGRMEIPPPVNMSGFQATHTTTARLNVRDSPTTTAPLVTTLEIGTKVQILETGSTATIGEITAQWVRVLAANGFSGWCFSGFLEAIVVEGAVTEYQPAQPPAVFVPQADNAAESGIPALSAWVWFVVGGGVAITGGVVFMVRRKR